MEEFCFSAADAVQIPDHGMVADLRRFLDVDDALSMSEKVLDTLTRAAPVDGPHDTVQCHLAHLPDACGCTVAEILANASRSVLNYAKERQRERREGESDST